MAWFIVGWTGIATYSCMGAFWWRAMMPRHCEKCSMCDWRDHEGKFGLYADHEMHFFFGAVLWPLTMVLQFLGLLVVKPIVAAIRGIITPAPLALEPEPPKEPEYDHHDIINQLLPNTPLELKSEITSPRSTLQ